MEKSVKEEYLKKAEYPLINALKMHPYYREKLINMRDAGVDIIVDCCPFCHMQFDLGQIEVNTFFKDIIGEPFNIPVDTTSWCFFWNGP